MGFFGKLFGTPSESTQESGYSALPKDIQASFDPFAQAISQYTLPSSEGVTEAFTPLPVTAEEETAFGRLREGVTPTPETLQADIAMQMNPYEQSVIDEINRQSQSPYSILKSALTEAGQFGSSRQLTGASDIERRRLGQIEQFKGAQFNEALKNALTTLPELRGADIQGLLGIGGLERGLAQQTALAPVTALGAGTELMSPFLTGGTATSVGSTPGMIATLSGAAKNVSGFSMPGG